MTMQADDLTLAGVDGCKGGWIAALADPLLTVCTVQVFPHFPDIFGTYSSLQTVAVDIPIGLLDKEPGERVCDKAARAVLGKPRSSSVFPAPRRFVLNLGDGEYEEAKRQSTNKGLKKPTIETFYIRGKVRELDEIVLTQGQEVIREIHPEVSFWAMNGERAMAINKKKNAGHEERFDMLVKCLGGNLVNTCKQTDHRGAALDDLYDALAALWSAQRIFSGVSQRLPAEPPKDARGLVMEINY